jgi:pectinesterase inhibitor-like protein
MNYKFNKTLLVILSLSSLLLSSNAVPSTRVRSVSTAAPKVDPVITKLCNDGLSTYETRCIETLSKLFHGPFDIVKAIEIIEIEVNATLNAAKTIFDTIIKLRNDTASTDKKAIAALDDCIEYYDMIVAQVSTAALELLPQKKLFGVYDQISSVLQYNGFCQDNWDGYFPDKKPWDATPLIMPTVLSVDILNHLTYKYHKY